MLRVRIKPPYDGAIAVDIDTFMVLAFGDALIRRQDLRAIAEAVRHSLDGLQRTVELPD
jgi:hypothetical protein